jgi:hypothetical protein
VTANSPALVQNDGWEFTFSGKIIHTKSINWSVSFNTGINRNKLIAYPNFEQSPYVGTYVIGKPLNITRILHYTGVDPKTGLYTFEDKDKSGDITVDFDGKPDDTYIINLNPKFSGGMGTNFNYKRLQLNLFFNFVKQIGVNVYNQGNYPGTLSNQPVEVLNNHWQKVGDISPTARFTTQPDITDYYYKSLSDGGFTDASYIRLSNLSLSYNLPDFLIKKAGIKNCSIFFNTNNVFVITKYKGTDPETQTFGGLPPAKIFSGGISFNF